MTPAAAREKARVLIVDDREENLFALSSLVRDIADEVITAHSGAEALRCVERPLALILLDVTMPGMDGFETASLIRQRPAAAPTPIVFLTASREDQKKTFQGYSLGAVDFLYHPIANEVLRAKTAVFVDLFRKSQELMEERIGRLRKEWEAEQLRVEIERERKNAQTSGLLRLFVESVKEYGIFTMDPGGVITTWNEAAQRILGYEESEILGKHFSIIFQPEDIEAHMPENELSRAEKTGRSDDYRWHRRKDGSLFWAEGIVTPLYLEHTLLGFCKLVKDETARKMNERSLKEAYEKTKSALEALAQVEARFKLFADSVEEYAAFMTDPENRVTHWNGGAEKILGYSEEEIRGKSAALFFTPEDRERGAPEQELKTALEKGCASDHRWHIRKDGRRFWANGVVTPLRNDRGELLGFGKVMRDETERRRLEEEVKETKARLELALGAAVIGTWDRDLRGNRAIVDKPHQILMGLPTDRTELTVEEWSARLHPEDLASATEKIHGAIVRGQRFELEYRIVKPDGSIRWILNKGAPYFDENNQPVRMTGTIIDITERKEFEEKLRTWEQIFLHASWGVVAVDPQDGIVKLANPAFANLHGYSVEESIGLRSANFYAPEARGDYVKQRELLFEKGQIIFETIRMRKDGTRFPALVQSNVIRDKDGRIQSLVSSVHDITDRRRWEEALAEKARLLDLSYDAIFVRDFEGRILDWNRGAEEMYGWKKDEVLGQSPEDLFETTSAVSLAEIKDELQKHGRWEGELSQTRRDGTKIIVLSRWAIERGDTPKSGKILETHTDISRMKAVEEQLRRSEQELSRSNQDLAQFAHIASHDLKEPLRMISAYVRLLKNKYSDRLDVEGNEYIDFAIDGASRMRALIEDLLAFSRLGTDSRSRRFELVSAEAVLEDVRKNLEIAIKERKASLTNDPLPIVYGEPIFLAQLFQNLIGNAIKYNQSAIPSVHVSAVETPVEWIFKVHDNGIGIDMSQAGRIFEPFQRLHGRADYPGTGMGLATCKRIVELHGGRIWVESTFGEGATFYFTLPKREVY